MNGLQEKISDTKALKGKTVEDILQTEEFRQNIGAYLHAQRQDRLRTRGYLQRKSHSEGRTFWPNAHVIDRLDYLTGENFADYFAKVVEHRSGLPKSERDYIEQLGLQALNKTIADFIIAEHPELEEEIYKK